MRKPSRFPAFALVVLGLAGVSGCVRATFVPTGGAYPAKAIDCDIQVFMSAVPDRAYEEMGVVEGEGSWWKAETEDVLPKMKEEACLAGGDAIIFQESDTFAEGVEGGRIQRILATVIRWKSG
jgi:hypothetical protein